METVCLNGVLEESIAAFYAALTSRGIQPQIHMSGKRIEKQLNRDALSRVFSNILNNALKYSDGDLEITLRDDGEIVFANTASGLNEIQVGKLFDRFFTVEAARNLGGLGLAISKTLVEQMGGNISAKLVDHVLSIQIGQQAASADTTHGQYWRLFYYDIQSFSYPQIVVYYEGTPLGGMILTREEKLMIRIGQGDMDAVDELIGLLYPEILRYCL